MLLQFDVFCQEWAILQFSHPGSYNLHGLDVYPAISCVTLQMM